MKLEQITESQKEIDSIIDHFDYFDTAHGMGIDFIERDVKKRYPELADKILQRVEEMIKKNTGR